MNRVKIEKSIAIMNDDRKNPWKSLSESSEKLFDILWEETEEIPGSISITILIAAIAVNQAP